jgi:2-polyprenyl-6-methoxyphenol hydroxylase-like FAD-dependent oxidoreductase
MRIVIMGAGMAGLSAVLALARAGHKITLLERDSVFQDGGWEAALQRSRDGIAHFLQPHVFRLEARFNIMRCTLVQELLRLGTSLAA